MTEKTIYEDPVIVPLEQGGWFETDTPPNKRLKPKTCVSCLTSPGQYNTKDLEQEITIANLNPKMIEDILRRRVPACVKIPYLNNGQILVRPWATFATTKASSTLALCPALSRRALFVPFLRGHPLLRFCIACILLYICLILAAVFTLQDGIVYVGRLTRLVVITCICKPLRAVVLLSYRLCIASINLLAVCLSFGLNCWVAVLLGAIRFVFCIFL